MPKADAQQATESPKPESQQQPESQQRKRPETRLDDDQIASGGGLHYHQARREPGGADERPSDVDAVRQQVADEHGGPSPDDESWLQDQGYPKLGPKIQSRVTQHEHGPYAGGTQQGDTETQEKAEARGER